VEATEKRWRRLYLIRHGEVSYFDSAGKPLRPDTVPLDEEGRQQAAALAAVLGSVLINRVVSSDLKRSVQTAEALVAGRNLQLDTREALREIQPGRLADIPPEGLEASFIGAFKTGIEPETRFLAGETFGSFQERVLGQLKLLLAEPGWRHLLIVAHGGVNRVILTHALGTGLKGFSAIEQDAGCLNIIDIDVDGEMLVRLLNHTPTNAAKVGLEMTTMERIFRQYRR
jgi:probable phosphoglycerate mutase